MFKRKIRSAALRVQNAPNSHIYMWPGNRIDTDLEHAIDDVNVQRNWDKHASCIAEFACIIASESRTEQREISEKILNHTSSKDT
jgi:hypothetical protein